MTASHSDRQTIEQKRRHALVEMNRWLLECLDVVVGLPAAYDDLRVDPGHARTCEVTSHAIDRFVELDACGFWIVDANQDITPVFFSAPEEREVLSAALEHHIDDGTFAWAMEQHRPVMLPGRQGGKVMLHPLATRTRVVGMFFGRLPEARTFIPEAAQKLISIALAQCANRLETGMLYGRVLNHARDLERTDAGTAVVAGTSAGSGATHE